MIINALTDTSVTLLSRPGNAAVPFDLSNVQPRANTSDTLGSTTRANRTVQWTLITFEAPKTRVEDVLQTNFAASLQKFVQIDAGPTSTSIHAADPDMYARLGRLSHWSAKPRNPLRSTRPNVLDLEDSDLCRNALELFHVSLEHFRKIITDKLATIDMQGHLRPADERYLKHEWFLRHSFNETSTSSLVLWLEGWQKHVAALRASVPAPHFVPSVTASLLSEISVQVITKTRRQAVRFVFERILSLLEEGRDSEVDDLLSSVAPGDFPVEITLAFLSITIMAQHRLPARGVLRQRIKAHLVETRGPVDADRLLAGL